MKPSKIQLIIFSIVVFALFTTCDKDTKREICFYHWKTTLDFNKQKQEYADFIDLSKLYVRFFDVKWVESEQKAFPFATIQVENGIYDTTIQIIPTVYIANEAIHHTPPDSIPYLAGEIAHKILRLCKSRFYKQTNQGLINEIQIDCDWSDKTREKYFNLLQQINKSEYMEKLRYPEISATIRLHQVKYFDKTGIPPVNKGMLMFYNMGDLQNIETENSILDIDISKKYLEYLKDYPLPCDIALPLYSWAVVFREGKIVKLINNISSDELKQHKKFKQIKDNRFKVVESNYINKNFVYKGDELRVEEVSKEKLQTLMELIVKNANNKHFSLCFFHLDDVIINRFSGSDIYKIAEK